MTALGWLKNCFIALLIFLTFLPIGCSTTSQKAKVQKRREALEIKKRNYEALSQAVATRSLATGISPEEIRSRFGEPDDIFSSGSMTGIFEIWVYERVLTKEDPDWRPIRLYFNNNQLITWSY